MQYHSKTVNGYFHRVQHKQVYSNTEYGWNLEISDLRGSEKYITPCSEKQMVLI